jgi:hypothetical protein
MFQSQTVFEVQMSVIQGVTAKIFQPKISVIFQRIFVKFKMQIF